MCWDSLKCRSRLIFPGEPAGYRARAGSSNREISPSNQGFSCEMHRPLTKLRLVNVSETTDPLASASQHSAAKRSPTKDEEAMPSKILRLPHCPQTSPLLISHSLLQLADVVWNAGLPGLATDLVGLAHSAIDHDASDTPAH